MRSRARPRPPTPSIDVRGPDSGVIRRISARARLAGFAALLCVVAVLGVALPLSVELNSQQAQSQRQAVVALAQTIAQLQDRKSVV